MSKVKLNPLIESLSGKMGDVVFKVSKSGETTFAKARRRLKRSQARHSWRNGSDLRRQMPEVFGVYEQPAMI